MLYVEIVVLMYR